MEGQFIGVNEHRAAEIKGNNTFHCRLNAGFQTANTNLFLAKSFLFLKNNQQIRLVKLDCLHRGMKRSHDSEEEQLHLTTELSQGPIGKLVKLSTVSQPSGTE